MLWSFTPKLEPRPQCPSSSDEPDPRRCPAPCGGPAVSVSPGEVPPRLRGDAARNPIFGALESRSRPQTSLTREPVRPSGRAGMHGTAVNAHAATRAPPDAPMHLRIPGPLGHEAHRAAGSCAPVLQPRPRSRARAGPPSDAHSVHFHPLGGSKLRARTRILQGTVGREGALLLRGDLPVHIWGPTALFPLHRGNLCLQGALRCGSNQPDRLTS